MMGKVKAVLLRSLELPHFPIKCVSFQLGWYRKMTATCTWGLMLSEFLERTRDTTEEE
jgi:hypothetical protein